MIRPTARVVSGELLLVHLRLAERSCWKPPTARALDSKASVLPSALWVRVADFPLTVPVKFRKGAQFTVVNLTHP